ncbi:MAG: hypothetical protein IKS29_05985 [Oscillospiraceae bacterium]|nr:hypothetical protein [Oscillospiraceae bacterium]
MAETERRQETSFPRRALLHTGKVVDSCLDKDCIEDIRVYLTEESQAALEQSTSTKARSAELLNVFLDVQPVTFHKGYYSVDISYYYKVIADAVIGGTKPVTIYGLALFAKRIVLSGGAERARVFSSRAGRDLNGSPLPEAVVEAVDPVLLSARVVDVGESAQAQEISLIPDSVRASFDDTLVFSGEKRRLYVTLGQFSIVRMEREAPVMVQSLDYELPDREYSDDPGTEETPYEAFGKLPFPSEAFYSTDGDL